MRFRMKTSYAEDIAVIKDGHQAAWYAALAVALIAAPWLIDEYLLAQLSFVCIYAIAGVGLMLLTGYTGQISLGHAAFFAAGAYTAAILEQQGVGFLGVLPAAALVAAALGVVIGLPALRLSGIYLAMATLAFAFIVEEVLARWESLTNGNDGMVLDDISIVGLAIDSEPRFYYLALALLVLVMLGAINILRSPSGRAMIAVRDSGIAAESLGVSLARTKTAAFALSAAVTGIAGALYAHKLSFISPEQFTIFVSIELLLIVFIGGLGSLHGAVLGAIFIIVLPQAIVVMRDALPRAIAEQAGLEAGLFGLALILFMIFEPRGLYGIWFRARHYLRLFPLYRKATFRRQKSYIRGQSN